MTEELAKRVGSKGYVYAIDINDEQVEEAKKRCSNLENVTFIKCDAQSLEKLPIKDFD